MKKIGRSSVIGQRGIAHIEGVVLSMGLIWYPTGGVEAGIDGFIELRDEITGVVGNLLLQVQGKATERQRLQAETDETFEFTCSEDDIAYWLRGTAPVLFVVVLPEKGLAYWKLIRAWFSDPDRLKARKIVFDKEKDLFTKAAKAAIVEVALSTSPGATALSHRTEEELLVNLLRVRFAPDLYWAPTEMTNDKAFGAALRELDRNAGSEWIVRGGGVLSFQDLDSWPWKRLCAAEGMERFDTDEWANSDDEDRRRDFVALLNRAIGQFVRPELWHDRTSRMYFFAKPRDRQKLRYAYRSLTNYVPREVVRRYGARRDNPSEPSYWRHSAFLHKFVRLGDEWYVEITPTYHFTRDGYKPDELFGGERLKKIKEFENNAAVMGQFAMWRFFLENHGANDLVTKAYPFLSFQAVPPLTLDVGVPDDLWRAQEADPDSPLFDWAQVEAL